GDGGFGGRGAAGVGGVPGGAAGGAGALGPAAAWAAGDIELLERHEHAPDAPIRTPIHAVVGGTDPVVSRAEMEAWALETSGDFRLTELRGGHFYFQQDPSALLSLIRDQLTADDRLVLAKGA